MAEFTIGVMAFISVTVAASSEAEAREAADHYVETSLSPDSYEVDGWNEAQDEEGVSTRIVSAGGFSIEGQSTARQI